jgi:DNA-binding GntR family transcriptional regulator
MDKAPGRLPSLTDFAIEQIRTAIISGELRPGSFTTAEELAIKLGVSRTPVREALLWLERAGMVRIERKQGVRILDVTEDDLYESFQLRLLLEVPATSLAAQRVVQGRAPAGFFDQLQEQLEEMNVAARDGNYPRFMASDTRFHELIHLASGNRELARIVREIRQTITDRHVLNHETPGLSLEDLVAEHKLVQDALVTHSPEDAAQAMFDHVTRIGNKILNPGWYEPAWFAGMLSMGEAKL